MCHLYWVLQEGANEQLVLLPVVQSRDVPMVRNTTHADHKPIAVPITLSSNKLHDGTKHLTRRR